MHIIHSIDNNVLSFIQEHLKNSVMDTIMPVITSLGNSGIVWIVIAAILSSMKKYRKYGVMLALALIITLVIGNITLKPLIARTRPFDANNLKDILLIKAPKDYSFPSGHTMASFAAATVLIYMNRKVGIVAMVLAVLIAFSRLYLYVHYPSDVFAGMIFGILSAIISIKLLAKTKI
ncbi:phosphatase PAP2 family protein [uncultured Clostridium sp.]|uniref:phosphatase PAP2 family protein n=1 Tax=uncultured Clostridium sp. TaxID=59620 RepID=UPI0025DC1AE7|nr:phosphatase PAP2 family protein [uncultured Clostridium sp.]